MMQDKFYTKITRCYSDTYSIDNNDEDYRQILYSYESISSKQHIEIIIKNQFYLIVFIFLFLTSQSNALPIQSGSLSYPTAMVQIRDRSIYPQQSYNVYRRYPNPLPSYPNSAFVQVYDQTNVNNQQQQQPTFGLIQNSNQGLQLKRERQRRAMVDKILLLFDEDGNGQLTKDELYSMALRSNMFPKFHHYLKQTSV